jgi:hypothetical protein
MNARGTIVPCIFHLSTLANKFATFPNEKCPRFQRGASK